MMASTNIKDNMAIQNAYLGMSDTGNTNTGR